MGERNAFELVHIQMGRVLRPNNTTFDGAFQVAAFIGNKDDGINDDSD